MEASRVRNGIVEYYNQHISPKLDGKSCFVGGMVIGMATKNMEAICRELYKSNLVRALGVISESGDINVDALYAAAMEQMQQQKSVALDIPIIGRMTFDENDLRDLYQAISRQ